jgi:hypothetical protein
VASETLDVFEDLTKVFAGQVLKKLSSELGDAVRGAVVTFGTDVSIDIPFANYSNFEAMFSGLTYVPSARNNSESNLTGALALIDQEMEKEFASGHSTDSLGVHRGFLVVMADGEDSTGGDWSNLVAAHQFGLTDDAKVCQLYNWHFLPNCTHHHPHPHHNHTHTHSSALAPEPEPALQTAL